MKSSKLFSLPGSEGAKERASGSCGRSPGPRGLAGARLLTAKANEQRARLSAGRAAAPPGRGAGEGAGSAAPRGRAGGRRSRL